MLEHKRKKNAAQTGSGIQNIDFTQVMRDVDDNNLREELQAFKYVSMNIDMEYGRQWAFNVPMDTLDLNLLLEQWDNVFDSLKCAASLNVTISFGLKHVKIGSCQNYYAE